ncbi:hypothetical protein [Hansschlegelia zhihuaiae]|uniref:Uncharacterized protein n=1 Tax=Hansschlegelia zhihuaiae TaxID=405005 RepID=A0A4Q0MQV5_9HYPH|nr:hypothetical protein [Hansschlegelia zhihuaiae]RXF75609.1 hypothetical protein EK403_01850 [Hansschlegelia zhihuaiae]
MSMWLSAANTYASAGRGLVAAETKRTQNAVAQDMTRQAMAFWFPWSAEAAKPKPRARRRMKRS